MSEITGNGLNLNDILMRKNYLQPKVLVLGVLFDHRFLQSGGTTGTGQGSDMDDPDESQNPF